MEAPEQPGQQRPVPTPEELRSALKFHFGMDAFRPHQMEAIAATLSGRDSLLVLPTGGGKSLTFQLPPLFRGNCFSVVVGPLMALAKDQVDACLDKGIDARVWNSEVSEDARRGVLAELVSDAPDMRLLYTTPESLRHPGLRQYLKEAYDSGTLLSFAIDEAHCASEWGHDFRPAYLDLASLKCDFPNCPVAAMTASCTPTVEASITRLLGQRSPVVIKGGFNRPNIEYKVIYKELIGNGKQDDAVEHLVEFIKARGGTCGIIYARLRATCDWLGSTLGNSDLDVGVYHAGKDSARRRKVQQDWCEGGLDIVVATIAFGLGIDRADVRWVVHWDPPCSLEGLYQESGRAGRDGEPSESLVYVSADDLDTIAKLEKGSRAGAAAAVTGFACQPGCKRKKLLDYFGERRGRCDAAAGELLCDHCGEPAAARSLLATWEQQVQRRAVQHALREQRKAAALAGEDEGEQEAAAAAAAAAAEANGQDLNTQDLCLVSASAAAAAPGGSAWQPPWPSGGGGSRSSSLQHAMRARAGVWGSARLAAPSAGAANAGAGPAPLRQSTNTQAAAPAAAAPPAAAQAPAAGGTSTSGVVLPQASAAPAVVPQLRKRRPSRGQPGGAFKAPRMQQPQPPGRAAEDEAPPPAPLALPDASGGLDMQPAPGASAGPSTAGGTSRGGGGARSHFVSPLRR